MCGPAAAPFAAQLAITAVSTAMAYQASNQQAKAQTKQYEANKANSLTAMRDEQAALQTRQQQENMAASEQIQNTRLEELKRMSTANVAFGESGMTGATLDRAFRDIQRTAGNEVMNIQQNRDWTLDSLNQNLKGSATTALSRINSVSKGTKPNLASFLISGAGQGLSHYTQYKQNSK